MHPKEICLEDLGLALDDDRYIRCVALPGGEPGLALDREGEVRWMPDSPCAYGLWVSADDRLVLLREEGSGPITVQRSGRSQEAPVGKPVILVNGDQLTLQGRCYKVHVHGQTELVYPPAPTNRSALARAARAAAAALALGAVVGAGGSTTASADSAIVGDVAPAPIEVRARSPAPPRRKLVHCSITKQVLGKKGHLVVNATCPGNATDPLGGGTVGVGARGQLLDPKTRQPLKDGGVIVKKATNNGKIVAEAMQLKKATRATSIRFYVRR
jgi:hypothetical protein